MSFSSFYQRLVQQAPQVFFTYDLAFRQLTHVNAAYTRVLEG